MLNLETQSKEQELIKKYLEDNASDILKDKINNGVKIVKDNKNLISKKDLNGFMKFAQEEARKLAEKGANCACVEDTTVYGWAIHYFEEDSIEGTLYNEDGTEYAPVKKEIKSTPTKVEPKKPENKQATLFDMLNTPQEKPKEEISTISQPDTQEDDEEDFTEDEIDEIVNECKEIEEEQLKLSPVYEKYLDLQYKYPEHLTLLCVGDFYEAYNQNAEKISKVLDLTITTQDVGLKERVKLAGFPYHKKYENLEKLAYIYDIAVLEQGNEIKVIDKVNQTTKINTETGEVTPQTPAIDKEFATMLYTLLEGKMEAK